MEGFSVVEIPVTHHPRRHGHSKYGVWNRLFKSFADLLAIRWMKRRMLGYRVEEELGPSPSIAQTSVAQSGGKTTMTSSGKSPKKQRKWRHYVIRALVVLAVVGIVSWGAIRTPEPPAQGDSLNDPAAMATTEPATLRVATFNIAGGIGQIDLKQNLPRTASVVHDFDLIGMQEVHGGNLLDSRDQAQILGEILNKPWLYAPTEKRWWRDAFGNAIFCDLPVVHWQRFPLSTAVSESNRNVLLAKVMFHGKVVNVIITHIDRHSDHDIELESVIQLFLGMQEPAILMGDLNTYPNHPLIEKLLKEPGVVDAVQDTAGQNLDWIFVRGLKRIDGGTVDHGASDHPMFWAELGDADK
jgi:endonuclease/exonuclease/phosphatase family metal-dependent hydrolase